MRCSDISFTRVASGFFARSAGWLIYFFSFPSLFFLFPVSTKTCFICARLLSRWECATNILQIITTGIKFRGNVCTCANDIHRDVLALRAIRFYSRDFTSNLRAGLKTTKRISRVIRVSERFRASVSRTVTGLRGTPSAGKDSSCKRYRSDGTNDGDPLFTCCDTNWPRERGRDEEVTMISLLGSLVALINRP